MTERCEVAIIGSGFAGSLLARILARLGYAVVLLERGTHPRFAIGESSTPIANLCLERLGLRYRLPDCVHLAAHGRWLDHLPELHRGLKRGFTFYRHHPHQPLANRGVDTERLLVAASPNDAVSDTHWLRADVDHHFVREAVAAGADYRDRVELTEATVGPDGVLLQGRRQGASLALHAGFVVDASGPGGFMARQLKLPSGLKRTETRAALVFSHFTGVRPMAEVLPGLLEGPFPDDWSAMHHLIDEGWMYSLRFDHGVTSAGFLLSPRGLAALTSGTRPDPAMLWRALLDRYPSVGAAFANAKPLFPPVFRHRIQHRLTRASGPRWVMLPHAYAFVDALFSTGIAWALTAIERLALCFEQAAAGPRRPADAALARYSDLLHAEADQVDRMVSGAYESMAHFELFAAHAMIYFATVSFAEVRQRLGAGEEWAWNGFLGVGDPVSGPLPGASRRRLRRITGGTGDPGTAEQRRRYVRWVADAIAPRNIAGFADPARHHLYPVDLDLLIARHDLLGLKRDQVIAGLPALRGMIPLPAGA